MQETVDDNASILIVDDRPANLVALRAVLEPLAQRLVEARSGEDALKLVLREDFACILLDVQMPGMDGFETASLIKQRDLTRHVPILFLTAVSTGTEHAVRGYSEGAVDYIVKPFDPDMLRAKVRVFVDLWKREQLVRSQEARIHDRERQVLRAEREHLMLRERQARDEAERIERRLVSMTQNATVGLVMMDARQHCVFMNPAAKAITGFTLSEVQGKPLHEFVHHTRPDCRPFPMEECPIDRALPTRMREQGEDVFVRKDGSTFPMELAVSETVLPEGRVFTGIVRDISARKQAEEELKRSAQFREQFIGILGHDLRGPLSAVKVSAGTLLREPLTDLQLRAVHRISTSTDRMTRMIAEILDFARGRLGGGIPVERRPSDLCQITRAAVDGLAAAHPERTLEFRSEGACQTYCDRSGSRR